MKALMFLTAVILIGSSLSASASEMNPVDKAMTEIAKIQRQSSDEAKNLKDVQSLVRTLDGKNQIKLIKQLSVGLEAAFGGINSDQRPRRISDGEAKQRLSALLSATPIDVVVLNDHQDKAVVSSSESGSANYGAR